MQYGVRGLSWVVVVLMTGCGDAFGVAPPTCRDGAWNGDEAGVDCGGSCGVDCVPLAACSFDACPCSNYVNNPSEIEACEQYLECYRSLECLPEQPCRGPDGVCGVNTIGGGAGPELAAVAVWDCACP